MRIGILTFHNAHNYGAVLQAFALKSFLVKQGHQVKIINYQNAQLKNRYSDYLLRQKKYPPNPIFWARNLRRIINQFQKDVYAQRQWKRQCEVFNQFIKDVLLDGNSDEILYNEINSLNLDMYVCGSDQIWETAITGVPDPAYFLDFKTKALKISYAASMSSNQVPDKYSDYYKEKLKDFDALSARESAVADTIRELCQEEVETVVDPALLLDAKDYEKIEAPIDVEEKYIFAYFISENNDMMSFAKNLSETLKMKLIELHYYALKELEGHDYRADMGPGDFLSYIKKAEIVITNSFHGVIFSIIYKKNFWAVYDTDSRKDGLLNSLGLSTRHIKNTGNAKMEIIEIEYEEVYAVLNKMRKKSVDYLKSNCK